MSNKKFAKMIKVIMPLTMVVFNLFSCADVTTTKTELTLISLKSNTNYLNSLVNEYNKQSDNYYISVIEYDSTEKIRYDFLHDKIKPDFISFKNINDANYLMEDRMAPLSSYEFIGRYQSNIVNYLKKDNDLFVVPGLGSLYSECYNDNLMKEQNIQYPETMNELKLISSRMKNLGYNPTVINGGDEFILDTLMEASVAKYFSSTKGNDTLNKLYLGETSIANNEELYSSFESIFKEYLNLFRTGYFNLDNYTNTIENTKNEFLVNESAFSIFNNSNIDLKNNNTNLNFKYYPFVSDSSKLKYIASKPTFYLGSPNNSIENKEKKSGIIDFYNLFSSEIGQKLLNDDLVSNNDNFVISYIKDIDISFQNTTQYLEDSLRQGRNYLVDTFRSVFSDLTNEIYSYLKDNLDGSGQKFEVLANNIDNKLKLVKEQREKTYIIDEDFDYNVDTISSQETIIGNFTADALRTQSNIDIAIIPSKFITFNLYKGIVCDYELNIIFDEMKVYKVRITGEGIKQLIKSTIHNSDTFPLISGIRLNMVNEDLNVITMDKNKIDDKKEYYVLLGEDYFKTYEKYISSFNYSESALNIMRTYFNNNSIKLKTKDGRYGNVIGGE